MCITGSPISPEVGIWEMREVIQIGDTLKVAVSGCLSFPYKELHNKNKRFVGQQWPYSTFHRFVEQGSYPMKLVRIGAEHSENSWKRVGWGDPASLPAPRHGPFLHLRRPQIIG